MYRDLESKVDRLARLEKLILPTSQKIFLVVEGSVTNK